jgi:hypothetical protein
MATIHDKAMLVTLNVRTWSARRYDDTASEIVAEHHHSKKDMGRYNKCLVDVKEEVFKRPIQIANEIRAFHYSHTLPWSQKGACLLPAAEYLEYSSKVQRLAKQLREATEELADAYPRLKAKAKRDLNGLYNEGEYPSADEVIAKYGVEVAYLPVPSAEDFRVNVVAKDAAKIKAQITAQVEEATEQAMKELWTRLHDVASKMAAALADPDRRFHDTLVGNVKELVEVLPRLNLTEDKTLKEMTEQVRKQLTKHDADTLRDNPATREVVAKRARELAEKMASFVRT